jgi:hypothetical protein
VPETDDGDGDEKARREALEFIARRALIWAAPLTIVGVLLIALGIPWWLSTAAMVATLAVLVLEIDL